MKLTLALAQINTTLGVPAANLEVHLAKIAEARQAGADLLVFPELSLTGYVLQDLTPAVAIQPSAAVIIVCGHPDILQPGIIGGPDDRAGDGTPLVEVEIDVVDGRTGGNRHGRGLVIVVGFVVVLPGVAGSAGSHKNPVISGTQAGNGVSAVPIRKGG